MSTQEDVDKAFSSDGVIEVMLWAKREGLIREIGFTTHNEDIALQCIDLLISPPCFPDELGYGAEYRLGQSHCR